MNPEQAMRELRIGHTKLSRLLADGTLHATGHPADIDDGDVAAYLAAHGRRTHRDELPDTDTIVAQYLEMKSYRDVGALYGVSDTFIRRLVLDHVPAEVRAEHRAAPHRTMPAPESPLPCRCRLTRRQWNHCVRRAYRLAAERNSLPDEEEEL